MKLFQIESQSSQYDRLTNQMTNLISITCQRLLSRQKLEVIHMALFLFHCQAKVVSYHSFDRFIYASAAIFIASKLTENMQFRPVQIIKTLRTILRQKKGLQMIEDSQQKLKILTKKLFEAQVTIMINIGFDFDIELAIFWINQWNRAIKDGHIIKKVEEALTSLYRTNTVLYFQPQIIALSALSIVIKDQGINLALCDWDTSLIEKIQTSQQKIKQAKNFFVSKQGFIYY